MAGLFERQDTNIVLTGIGQSNADIPYLLQRPLKFHDLRLSQTLWPMSQTRKELSYPFWIFENNPETFPIFSNSLLVLFRHSKSIWETLAYSQPIPGIACRHLVSPFVVQANVKF